MQAKIFFSFFFYQSDQWKKWEIVRWLNFCHPTTRSCFFRRWQTDGQTDWQKHWFLDPAPLWGPGKNRIKLSIFNPVCLFDCQCPLFSPPLWRQKHVLSPPPSPQTDWSELAWLEDELTAQGPVGRTSIGTTQPALEILSPAILFCLVYIRVMALPQILTDLPGWVVARSDEVFGSKDNWGWVDSPGTRWEDELTTLCPTSQAGQTNIYLSRYYCTVPVCNVEILWKCTW